MSEFTRPLNLVLQGNGFYRLATAFEYHIGFEGSRDRHRVERGYLTDLDSSPWGTRWLVRMNTNHNQGDVGHDSLYTINRILAYIKKMGGRVEPTDWIRYEKDGIKVYLSDFPARTRKECDRIYLEMLETLDRSPYTRIPAWRRNMMYWAVRLGGGWDMNPKEVFARVYDYDIKALRAGSTHS